MRISVGGHMSDWKNDGLRVIDRAMTFNHPDGTTFILCATGIESPCKTTLWSTNQLRAFGSEVNDIATVRGGKSNIITPCNINLPLDYRRGLMILPIIKPTTVEVEECDHIDLSTTPWDPRKEFDIVLDKEDSRVDTTPMADFDPSNMLNVESKEKEPVGIGFVVVL